MRRTTVLAWLLCLLAASGPGALAAEEEKPTVGLRYPSLTPDNRQVVFSYRGDIWIAPTEGTAPARRLTIHEAQDTLPRVSPDGTRIAFSSLRNGNYDLFVMPVEGGVPRQVTSYSGVDILCDWSPDGKRLLFVSHRQPGPSPHDLYEVDVEGGTPRRVTTDGGREGSYGPDGRVVYVRGFNTIYQDDYEGSANHDLHVVDAPGALPRRLLETARNERYPWFAPDGKTVWFVTEEQRVADFHALREDGTVVRLTNLTDDVWRPDLGWDGRTVVFEQVGRLHVVDLAAEKPAPRLLDLKIRSDVRHGGVEVRTITDGATQVDVSRDGQTLAFSVHGDLWSMPSSGGTARRLTTGPATDEVPRWSPDGRTIAYQSNQGGDSNLWLLDVAAGTSRQLTADKANDFFHDWHPDGRRLVFCSERSGNRDIWDVEVESGTTRQLTRHAQADDDPTYSPDGRWIAFDSARDGAQAIFVMPADGGEARRISQGGGFYQVPTFSPDGTMVAFESFNPAGGGSGGLFVVGVQGGPQVQISRDGAGARWARTGEVIYFTADRASGGSQIYRVPAPRSVEAGERVPFLGRVEVDLRSELADLFDEAWTRLKEGFYDPKMHGVDWDKLKARYRDMAIDAENKDEFQNVVRQMLAELGASHLGIEGGHRPANLAAPNTPATGHLGLELDATPVEGGRRVASIFRDGPADKAGLRVGDVVLSIQGKRLEPAADLDQILAGTVGKATPVQFRPITAEGLGAERRVEVTPTTLQALNQLRYEQWTRRSAEIVREETRGRAVYIHLNAMDGGNLQRFRQAVERWNQQGRAKGLVLDVRDNGGGNIHEPLMEILRARPYAWVQARGSRARVPQPTLYWEHPVVVLVNERSFSDAEVFPHAFQSAGLGKVVGVPTPGGVIGTNDITLSDGSRFRIPRTGFWNLKGTNLEGNGVVPDVLVVETPEDRRAGRDPQLVRAVEVLMEEVEARAKAARAADQAAAGRPEPTPPSRPAAPEAPTPATPPPEAPEPGRPAPSSALVSPLADAEVGEWVRYQVRFGGSETTLKLVVTEVTEDEVVFDREIEKGGEFVPPLPDRLPRAGTALDHLESFGPVESHETSRGPVGGAEAGLLVAKLHWGGNPIQVVLTDAVPGLGLLRVTWNGQTVLEAVEWSAPPASSTPASSTPASSPPTAPSAVPPVTLPPVAPPTPERPAPPPSPPPAPPEVPPTEARPAAPASATPLENPLYDAAVGEWVRIRHVTPEGEAVVTMEVVEVTADEVVLQSRVERGGEAGPGPAIRRARTRDLSGEGEGEGTWSTETLVLGGREVVCHVLASPTRRGGTVKRWFSNEVPVTGLARVERDGRLIREVVEWGRPGTP
jgi:tricorn protease